MLHLTSLLINTLRPQRNPVVWFSVVSSVLLKILSIISLLAADTSPFSIVLFCCTLGIFTYFVIYWLEKKLTTSDDKLFLKVVQTAIFPLPVEIQNTKSLIPCMQLLVGNTAAAIMGFSMTLVVGVSVKNMFITYNIVQVIGVQVVLLIPYSSLIFFCSILQASSPTEEESEDVEEDVTESSAILGNQLESNQDSSLIRKVVTLFVLLLLLVLILISILPMLMFMFNTCPPLHSTQHSNISCSSSPQIYGTTCSLSCPPLYWSADLLDTRCELGGSWSVSMFTCRPQVAALIGQGYNEKSGEWYLATDIYPPSKVPRHPALPVEIEAGKQN